ncbi:YopX family protein [Staphylococcus xylosus]|uniref:YopX family protein n=1 Tax=Staphylococcus xylosus TaxID=1288 RepID=UPI003F563368
MIPKFRAWDKKTKLMNDVTVVDFENKEVYYNHWRYGHSEAISFKDVELLQSTGIKDRNGVEIFEGDIISCEIETIEKFIICEQCGCFGIRDKIDGFISLNSINETLSIHKEFEVIGNIYEHPHLLEE